MKRLLQTLRRGAAIGVLLLAGATVAVADQATLLILHTNDLHDHVRPGYHGLGGLPYVSGYVRRERAARPDVLVLDAGDVTEKGDLVAFRDHSRITFEGLRRVGYDGVVVGNHDFDDVTRDRVREWEKLFGQELLCLNIRKADGSPEFAVSRIVETGGRRIGVIGMIVPRPKNRGGLDFEESGRALAAEAARLAQHTDLVVAVCHESVEKCAAWARMAPDVQVFVSGHSHQALKAPHVVAETGARIVQAGSYARHVGRLEVTFDPSTRRIVQADGHLVPMTHDTVPVDEEFLARVKARERELAPDANELVLNNPAELDYFSVARLAAEGLRRASGADVGFCHTHQIIRAALPAGPVDVNAFFLTGGERGNANVLVELTGAEIEAYVNALVQVQREPPEWAGFKVSRGARPGASDYHQTDLQPDRRYKVVMPRLEWTTRFQRLAARVKERDPATPLAAREFTTTDAKVDFTTAIVAQARAILKEGDTLAAWAARRAREREQP